MRTERAWILLCGALAGCGGAIEDRADGPSDATPESGLLEDDGGSGTDALDPGCDDCADGGEDASAMDAAMTDAGRDASGMDAAMTDAAHDASAMDAAVTDAARDSATVDAGPADPLRIYMAADGDDARSGLSAAQAVGTLGRVHAIVSAMRPTRDVEVRIGLGTYYGQTVRWTYSMPDHAITFMPADGGTTRPLFDGCTSATGACPGGTWFLFSGALGRPSNLRFQSLRVQRYSTAISLNGNRDDPAGGYNGRNRIAGCWFERIGNVFNTALDPSTAAVRLVNSDDNEIANSHFIDVVNTRSGSLIHALYVAHHSQRNRITGNRFLRSSGDPVRVRDYSNYNVITGNTFIRVGTSGGYTDWYCDHDTATNCTKPTPECPSWENEFRSNVLDGDWSCAPLPTFQYFQGDSTTGCSRPSAGAVRLHTSGNTRTATPCSMN